MIFNCHFPNFVEKFSNLTKIFSNGWFGGSTTNYIVVEPNVANSVTLETHDRQNSTANRNRFFPQKIHPPQGNLFDQNYRTQHRTTYWSRHDAGLKLAVDQ